MKYPYQITTVSKYERDWFIKATRKFDIGQHSFVEVCWDCLQYAKFERNPMFVTSANSYSRKSIFRWVSILDFITKVENWRILVWKSYKFDYHRPTPVNATIMKILSRNLFVEFSISFDTKILKIMALKLLPRNFEQTFCKFAFENWII